MPLAPRHPQVTIQDCGDGRIDIHVHHYGRVPDLRADFSDDVLSKAVNKWRRTSREHEILTAARKLSPTAYRIVEAHLIRERALRIEFGPTWQDVARILVFGKPETNEKAERIDERAEFDPRRDLAPREVQVERKAEPQPVERATDDWFEALFIPKKQPEVAPPDRYAQLTAEANRALQEAKDKAPKISRAERKEMDRAHAEREEELRDLREFTPPPPVVDLLAALEKQFPTEKAPTVWQPERERGRERDDGPSR